MRQSTLSTLAPVCAERIDQVIRRLGKKNHRRIAGRQLFDQKLRGGKLEIAIGAGIEFAGPSIEKLHRGGAGGNLRLEVPSRGASDFLQKLAKRARLVPKQSLRGGEAVARSALHQVAGQRPGSAGESQHGNVGAKRFAQQANGIAHETRLALGIENGKRFHLRLAANRRSDHRACVSQFDGRAHRFRGNENIGKYDDGIDAQAPIGLQRYLGGKFRRLGHFQEAVLFAQRAILGQISPGLAHHPDRHARNGFAAAGAQE